MKRFGVARGAFLPRPSARRPAFVLLAWCVLGAACSGERAGDQWPISRAELEGKAPAGKAEAGKATYEQYCIGCHGADGRGNGGITGADFTALNSPLKRLSDAELAYSVKEGKRGERATMPAHSPVLSDTQIGEVIGYLRGTFQVR